MSPDKPTITFSCEKTEFPPWDQGQDNNSDLCHALYHSLGSLLKAIKKEKEIRATHFGPVIGKLSKSYDTILYKT